MSFLLRLGLFWRRGRGHRNAGDAARDRREWAVAAEEYRRYLALNPDAFAIWVQLGHMLKESGQYAAAGGAYGEAMRLNGRDADLFLNVGHLYQLTGALEQALGSYERSAELAGNQHAKDEVRRLRTKVRNQGASQSNLAAHTKESAPPPDSNYALALSWRASGSTATRTSLRLGIPWRRGRRHRNAGDAARDRREWVEAAREYRLYLELNPDAFAIWVQLGHMLKESGRYAESAAAYGEAMRLNARDADLLLSLGHLYKSMGDHERALSCYQRSVELDGNRHAQEEVRRLGTRVWNKGAAAQRPPSTAPTLTGEAGAGQPSAPQAADDKAADPTTSGLDLLKVPNPAIWALPRPPVRAIAYYLPQFHPFPQNNQWWGRGFTEWTNVTKAQAQFKGHYQPRRPGELGYYDLRIPEVQERQVELATIYGISGFCFYFYWFSGTTLMERPILSFLENKTIDFPFCLCWANENWTRRWDGLESDVLIRQEYSEEGDLSFITYVRKYLTNSRYIKIDQKPVLLVYRAELLPDPLRTAQSWREYCRAAGIGEIYLVCSHASTKIDPLKIGFDAAVEFPPNSVSPLGIQLSDPNSVFEGTLLDYEDVVDEATYRKTSEYPLLKGVFSSWDNTPRRSHGSTVFPNSTPALYGQYLESACRQVIEDQTAADQRVVFINAWNEWAEGAYLEPDERYGYAYLEATRIALIRAGARVESERCSRFGDRSERPRLAVIVHAYHLDVLEELIPLFENYPADAEFFFSTSTDQVTALEDLVARIGHEYTIFAVENRGRDVAPFLKVLSAIWDRRFQYVLKLHTKASKHRGDGHIWRSEIFRSIATPDRVKSIVAKLETRHDVGLVGAAEHVAPMSTYFGSNAHRVRQLARRLGVGEIDESTRVFVAGTMFVARLEALEPLMGLSLTTEDFDPEEGQVDGTLAHAIERAIAFSAEAAGLKICGVGPDGDAIEFFDNEPVGASFAFAEPTD